MNEFTSKVLISGEIRFLEQQLGILKDYLEQGKDTPEIKQKFYKLWNKNKSRLESHWRFHQRQMELYFNEGLHLYEVYPIFECPTLERERMDFENDMNDLRKKIANCEENSEDDYKYNLALMKVKKSLNGFVDGYREYLFPHFRDFFYPVSEECTAETEESKLISKTDKGDANDPIS